MANVTSMEEDKMKGFSLFILSLLGFLLLTGCQNREILISFEPNGGNIISMMSINDFETSGLPTPIKEGYTFLGWYTDASFTESVSNEYTFTKSITLYAKWEENSPNTFTVAFETNGGSLIESLNVVEGTSITAPNPPDKTGYTFVGWFSDDALLTQANLAVMPSQNITYYAKWQVNPYTISFVSNEGSVINPMTFNYLAPIVITQTPERLGYRFEGWYTDSSLTQAFTLQAMPANNITLYAKWDNQSITITFDSSGGSLITAIVGTPKEVFNEPNDPTRDGYLFCGWFEDIDSEELYSFDTFPDTSITLIADWGTEGLEYTLLSDELTYEVGMGTATELTSIQIPKYYDGKKVIKIMASGFYDSFIETITLPNTIEEIGNQAFMNSSSLTSFVVPDSLEIIGTAVFRYCHSLESFSVSENNDYYQVIDGILFNKNLEILVRYPEAKQNESYTVSNTVKTIAEDAFSDADNLVTIDLGTGVTLIKSHAFFQASSLQTIVVPNQVTEVELYAFRECGSLTSVEIGTGLTTISSYMFDSCTSLESIVIPDNILTIGYGAFYNCTDLVNVYIVRSSLNGLIQGALFMFVNYPSTFRINCPDQLTVDAYKVANYWSSYASKFQIGSV